LTDAWSRRPRAVAAFAAALALVALLSGRILLDLLFWAPPPPDVVAPWMTMRLIARANGLDPRDIDIEAGLPLPEATGSPRTLAEHARARGVPVAQVIAEVEAAIARLKARDPAAP
jgi:hypothetical protein